MEKNWEHLMAYCWVTSLVPKIAFHLDLMMAVHLVNLIVSKMVCCYVPLMDQLTEMHLDVLMPLH